MSSGMVRASNPVVEAQLMVNNSGALAPWVKKFGKLSIRENLVMT